MKFTLIIVPVIALTLALGGCNMTRQETGAVVGGVLGGVLGSNVGGGSGKTVATIIGAIAGAAIGGSVGRSMDELDEHRSQHALEHTRTGETYSWKNPDTGNDYSVTPTETWDSSSKRPCREYTTDATIDGRHETVYGTACREDGIWVASN